MEYGLDTTICAEVVLILSVPRSRLDVLGVLASSSHGGLLARVDY